MFDKILAERLRPMAPIPTGIQPGGGLKCPVKCILFDVYGTLLISGTGDISVSRKSVLISTAFQTLLDKFGIPAALEQVLESFFNGIQAAHQSAKRNGVDYPEVEIDRIWSSILGTDDMTLARRFALEFELMANPVYPMPHLESFLEACRKASLVMGIISNAQFYTPLLFRWFLKADPIDLGFREALTLYSYKIGYAKPSARIFDLAVDRLKELNISAKNTLYVGNDLQNDIIPAKRAGFQTALFAGDARSLRLRGIDIENVAIHTDLVITDLRQLLSHIPG